MPDKARKETDNILLNMEKRLNKIYNEAADDISKKWYNYMESHEKTLQSSYDALQKAKKSGDQKAIDQAQKDYDRVVRNVTLNNDRYKAMLNETTTRLAHTNEIALDYVNGNMPKIYTVNYNEFANEKVDGYDFTLVNEQAVKNLATEDKSLLPKKKLDVPEDKKWNQKNINSEILQGILQGENINKIANRLTHVTDMNRNSSIRNARTMTTSAENKGRQDSFKKAEEDGVIMKRQWVATNDDRTRAWHSDLDGVEVDLDEPWENEYGEIMYPGDPSADPCNVYNCRCSIRAIVKGFKPSEEYITDIEIHDEPEKETKVENNTQVNLDTVPLPDYMIEPTQSYAARMSDRDVQRFNEEIAKTNYVASSNGSYLDPVTKDVYISQTEPRDTTVFHETTHRFDFTQDYTITEDWGKYVYIVDENGDFTGEKEWIPNTVVIKEHATFSDYVAHEWNSYDGESYDSIMKQDMINFETKIGTSGTYGWDRDLENVKSDLDAISNYLESRGVSKFDPDFIHLSDFISAISYDASLGSIATGGHGYEYWVSSDSHRVTEITAGYNLLRATGRDDLIEIERDLAPGLMKLIEKEWNKIW